MSELIDNRAHRIRTLKGIIKKLHQGADPESVRRELAEIVKETDASEIAAMEQEILAEGVPIEEVKSMCDLHASVVGDILRERVEAEIPPGHPVDTFRRENEALTAVISEMRAVAAELVDLGEQSPSPDLLVRWRKGLNDLMDIEKHYKRKENLLFSCLERHEITGPSKVMWGKDDEVRELLAALGEALAVEDATGTEYAVVAEQLAEPTLQAIEGMILKEDKILMPMSLQTLTEEEWGEIWRQSPEYGWCLVEPLDGYVPPDATIPASTIDLPRSQAVMFPTGALNYDQLLGIFTSLPVDVTFVDADDRVRFFSEGGGRVFERSKAIIGRKVQHCHPPSSVDVVERIVSDFRAAREDVAEFWIELQGKFVHIRYFAVRDADGVYLGTLEVTQDITHLRKLEGERRLLEYDSPKTA